MNVDFSKLITADDKAIGAAARQQESDCAKALAYLAETDWYVTRKVETGQDIPAEISAAREAARAAVG